MAHRNSPAGPGPFPGGATSDRLPTGNGPGPLSDPRYCQRLVSTTVSSWQLPRARPRVGSAAALHLRVGLPAGPPPRRLARRGPAIARRRDHKGCLQSARAGEIYTRLGSAEPNLNLKARPGSWQPLAQELPLSGGAAGPPATDRAASAGTLARCVVEWGLPLRLRPLTLLTARYRGYQYLCIRLVLRLSLFRDRPMGEHKR